MPVYTTHTYECECGGQFEIEVADTDKLAIKGIELCSCGLTTDLVIDEGKVWILDEGINIKKIEERLASVKR